MYREHIPALFWRKTCSSCWIPNPDRKDLSCNSSYRRFIQLTILSSRFFLVTVNEPERARLALRSRKFFQIKNQLLSFFENLALFEPQGDPPGGT